LRTVFLGTSEFAAAILRRLAGSAHAPQYVLTRPDRRSGRGRKLSSPAVAEAARELGLALAQPEQVNDPDARALIASASPDAVIVCAFGALIREPLLSDYEMLNVHPSLLPRWRGAAPIERAIMAGDDKTGVSIMRLTAGLDSGPVCLMASERITQTDTFGSLGGRLQDLGGELLLRALDESPAFSEQDESTVTYAEKITPADRLLDPALQASALERVVRALDPHIGARVQLADGTLIAVSRARLVENSAVNERLGVTAQDGRLLLLCRQGALELLEVKPPGGRSMEAAAYLRGHG
jgi:methionyl-tRNA formyltransferase